jgi:hypothetical protein
LVDSFSNTIHFPVLDHGVEVSDRVDTRNFLDNVLIVISLSEFLLLKLGLLLSLFHLLFFPLDDVFPVNSVSSLILLLNFLKNKCHIKSCEVLLGILKHLSVRSDLLKDFRSHFRQLSLSLRLSLFALIGDALGEVLEGRVENLLWVHSLFFVGLS